MSFEAERSDRSGQETVATSEDREFLKSNHYDTEGIMMDSSARDGTNTTTYELRRGLVLGKITSSGKMKEYDPSAGDGSETAVGILNEHVRLKDAEDNYVDAACAMVWHGYAISNQCIGLDDGAKTDLKLIKFT